MTSHRFTSQGTSYVLRPDPGRTRHDGARFVRPEGEPSLLCGLLAMLLCAVAAYFAVVAFSSPGSSSVNARTEAKRASAIEVGTRKDSLR